MPRTSWFLLIAVLAGLLLSRESRRPGPVGGIDRAFFDWLSANVHAPAAANPGGVTLVELDDAVIDASGRWPLSPLDYALFLQAVQKFDPAVIAVEPILDWPRAQPGNEEILVNQALTAPKLLLGARLGNAQGSPDAAPLAPLERLSGSVAGLPGDPEIVAAPNARLFPLATCGVTNLPAPGAPLREIPLLFRQRAAVLPSFTLQALRLWLQLAPGEISATPGRAVELGDQRRIAIDRAGAALLDASEFRAVNRMAFDDLLLLSSGQFAAGPDVAAAAARIKGGLVLLGRTDRAMQTFALTGVERASPAEVLAWAIESLRNRPTLRRASVAWDAGITTTVAALGMILLRVSQRRTFAVAAGVLAVYALGALCAFEMTGLWLPCALPVGLMLCLCASRFLPRGESA